MGACYMLQYIDKLAISQATLFNLRQDLVRYMWFANLLHCLENILTLSLY
jgi:hypothetical protein